MVCRHTFPSTNQLAAVTYLESVTNSLFGAGTQSVHELPNAPHSSQTSSPNCLHLVAAFRVYETKTHGRILPLMMSITHKNPVTVCQYLQLKLNSHIGFYDS